LENSKRSARQRISPRAFSVAERTEGLHFALGASIVTTKSWIQRIGGLEPIAHLLADDYELGNRIAEAGA